MEVAKTVPADVEEELDFKVEEALAAEPEAEALPEAVEFELVLPVADALEAFDEVAVASVAVAVFLPAFVVDWIGLLVLFWILLLM